MPEFNACTEWLDIPADKQPPNHYDLLGVVQFESDLDAIRTALIQRSDLVKSKVDDARRDDARRLQDDLNAAAECLLDVDAKTAYDQHLLEAKFFSTPEPKPATPKPVTTRQASAEPEITRSSLSGTPVESEPVLQVPTPASDDSEPQAVPKPSGRQVDRRPVRGMPNPTALEEAVKGDRQPVLDEPFDTSPDDDVAATRVKCPECGVTLKLKSRVSLGETHPCPSCELPFVLDADSVEESYELDLNALRAATDPPTPPEPLRKRTAPKPEPKEDKPVPKRGEAADQSELQPEKKKPKRETSPEPVPTKERRRKLFDLKNNPAGTGLAVGGLVAAVMLLSWMVNSGGPPPISIPAPAPYEVADTTPNAPRSDSTAPRSISDQPEPDADGQAEAESGDGQSTIVAETDDPQPDTPAEVTDTPETGVIDLIPLADVAAPSVIGNWSNDDAALTAAGAGLGQLPIEVGLPESYELTLSVDQVRGNNGVQVGLQVADRHVVVVIDGWSGQASGLTLIDGQPADTNESSAFGQWLSADEPNVIRCSVGTDYVRVTCNDLPVVDWRGDTATLQLPPEYEQPANSAVFLATDNTNYRVTRFELSSSLEFPEQPQPLVARIDSAAPVPDAAALKEAAALVREVFQSDINDARTPDQKLTLADTLLDQGQDKSNNDEAARYVMLKRARDLAVLAGDVDRSLSIMAVIRQDFQINTHSSRAAVFEALRTSARTPQTLVALADTTAKATGEALDVQDFDAAGSMLKTIEAISDRIRGRELQPVLSALRRDVAERQAMWEQFTAATTSLKADPYDSAACFARGRYLCFARGRWRAGLQAFSRTSNEELAKLARRDLAEPADAPDQLQLADDWWNWIQSDDKHSGFGVFPHYWYSRALPSLAGLAKAKAEKRIEQLDTQRVIRPIDAKRTNQPFD